jgi:hypothetical protein
VDEATTLELFEREHQRYPLPVEHIRGSDSLGCDVISFNEEAPYLRTLQTRELEPEDVARYIEVKGRSDRTSSVELSSNQRTAAEIAEDRFFLYRVYRDRSHPAAFEVAVLGNPVDSPAEEIRFSYNLAGNSGAEWYALRREEP